MQNETLIPQLFKTEYRKINDVLCKLFGLVHIEIAEDITNDTILLASETWGLKETPENPTAWLYLVAKCKTKDYLRHNSTFSDKIVSDIKNSQNTSEETDLYLLAKIIIGSQLQMIFAICTPIIPKEAQVGLALRILCGFGIEVISEAFLTNKENINKRLFRAKENHFLIESVKWREISKYHLWVFIACWNYSKMENAAKWENILQLYNQLLQIEYSPIAALAYMQNATINNIET